ncbi:putative ABC-type nitrate transporter [Helianthus annuus]|nr:putative ABC-type nitrate transporter [Helianthus annuus]
MEFNQLQKDVKEENGSRHKATEGRNNIFIKHSKRGGWTTFPFILGSMLTLTLTAGGWIGNLIVYLITKYNVKSIHATQVFNVVVGCMSLFPIVGAVLSDSFYGSFVVIALFSFVSLLGITLMTLTASFPSLRPPPCTNKFPCESPSKLQYGVLYTILGLACIGIGGTRYTLASMGADQFEDSNSVGIYFNWYFFVFYAATVLSTTAIIYVQGNVSWAVGFGICVVCNTVGVILFLSGKNFYRKTKPKGSPFTSIARVIIAAVRKRKVSSTNQEYNYDINDKSTIVPSDSFRFLNNGALKIESDGSNTRSWSLSTVQEVEDLKTLIRIMPLWSSSVMLSGLVGMFNNFTILQALSMDRYLGGSKFQIPASSFLSLDTLATSITICLLDRFIFPMWLKLTGWSITPLQRIGFGHVLNAVGLVAAALVEVRRLHTARDHNLIGLSIGTTTIVPISALWLLVPLTIMGISQAFLFPGQISLYYQEFPTSLRSTSTAMISLLVAVGFYLSTAITGLIQNNTSWLKDDLNNGRLDIVYWLLAAVGVVNFGYFLVCAKMFRHKLDI